MVVHTYNASYTGSTMDDGPEHIQHHKSNQRYMDTIIKQYLIDDTYIITTIITIIPHIGGNNKLGKAKSMYSRY